MSKTRFLAVGWAALVVFAGGCLTPERHKGAAGDQERQVRETEVPKAALEALKKLADKATIHEFAEEVEHGHRFYEGSWKGSAGNVDALVTESGDLVEVEEAVLADQVPAAVRDVSEREAGKDSKVTYEKKTMVLYEAHFGKGERGREIVFTPDGRTFRE